MKDNTKAFVMINFGEYEEITYDEFKKRCEEYISYKIKKLYPLEVGLLEVPLSYYSNFYKDKNRNEYIARLEKNNGQVSLESLDTEMFLGKDIVFDPEACVEDDVIKSLMIKQMRQARKLLSKADKALIYYHYDLNISENQLAQFYGVNQSTISRRLQRIIEKLKKLMKI